MVHTSSADKCQEQQKAFNWSKGPVYVMEDVIYEAYSEQPTHGVSIEMTENSAYATIST